MKDRKENGKFSIISVTGWLMGGLSLLNLIEELSPVQLLGKLQKMKILIL